MCAAISLMGQCSVFVRNREQFTKPPFNLKIDELFVARLTDFISELALKGWRNWTGPVLAPSGHRWPC